MKKTRIRKQSLQPLPKLKRKSLKSLQDYYRRKKLKCFVCQSKADVMHHFIPQSQSAFLRYDERNLIPLCNSCHFRHHCTSDPTIHGIIQIKKGEMWFLEINTLKKRYLDVNSRKFLEDKINFYENN